MGDVVILVIIEEALAISEQVVMQAFVVSVEIAGDCVSEKRERDVQDSDTYRVF